MTFRLFLLTLTFGSPAIAHDGARVWVAARDGALVTQASDDDFDPTTYAPARVFDATLSQNFGTFTTQFPGYEAPRDGSGDVADGTAIGFKLAGPLLTLSADPLTDATRLVPTAQRFGVTGAPQMAVSFPDVPPSQAAAFTRVTAAGVVNGYDFTETIQEHAHLAYTLLGDGAGATAAAPDGAYVLPMVLTSPALARSEWYFLSFAKNATVAEMSAARVAAARMAAAAPGDTDFDGAVDFQDLVTLAQNYGTTSGRWWATGDFDVDGAVGFNDLVALAQNYGSQQTFAADWALAQATVPEPMVFLAAAPLLVARRRRPTPP